MLRCVPADQGSWADVVTVLGARGPVSVAGASATSSTRESFAGFPAEVRAERMREQAGLGDADVARSSGLLAYDGDEPVGWVAVEPRPCFHGLVRNQRVPWEGREEDRADDSVWAITCVFVRAGHRRRGASGELVRAASVHARDHGADAVEGYPMTTTSAIEEELHVGTLATFLEAGFVEVSRPTRRRAVVRLELSDTEP